MPIRLLAACYISPGEMHHLPGEMEYFRAGHTLGINMKNEGMRIECSDEACLNMVEDVRQCNKSKGENNIPETFIQWYSTSVAPFSP
jgi:hypothetical protein